MSVLKLIRTTWGIDDFRHVEKWETLINTLKHQNFKGLEVALIGFRFNNTDKKDYPKLNSILKKNGMDLICQIHTCDYPEKPSISVQEHLLSFRNQIEESLLLEPKLINSHSGRDSWTKEEALEFFSKALEIEKEYGVPIVHETHRNRYFFSPWNTIPILDDLPNLKVNADLSHWVCVAERIFTEETDPNWSKILQKVGEKCHLIHSRVGHPEGPQVNDPRCKENEYFLHEHEKWWKEIWKIQQKQGLKTIYMNPEFGPPPYQQILPTSQEPVANLSKIVSWMAKRHLEHFNKL